MNINIHKKRYRLSNVYKKGTEYTMVLILSISLAGIFFMFSFLALIGFFGFSQENAVDFIVLGLLSAIGPIGFYNAHQAKVKQEIEDKLPDFLREIGSSTASGMTVFDAVRVASEGDYGLLTKELRKMTAQLSWGISIKEALQNFSKRLKSKPVERAVLTINQALDMGGNTSDTFYAAAKEIEQIKMVEQQRKTEMSMYSIVILISFFVFLAVILIINTTIFAAFFDLQQKVGTAHVGRIGLGNVDKNMLRYAFYSFVFVQSVGAGLLGGFMMDGRVSSGVRYSFVLILISFIAFRFLM
ncbi:MAG TPA: type II secretion system F family protein [Thermoplasmatales archaeon]|nr:type II secretion system F family protein [Thermoplasmatales archaeon]